MLNQEEIHTVEEILLLSDEKHAELLNGIIYMMASPSRVHQYTVGWLYRKIGNFLEGKTCEAYVAPFGVYIDQYNYIEPDISVICDRTKLSNRGCEGSPDWIVEVVSPSTAAKDHVLKTHIYQEIGAREYWIVDPEKQEVQVYIFEPFSMKHYSFSDTIPVGIYEGEFSLCLAKMLS